MGGNSVGLLNKVPDANTAIANIDPNPSHTVSPIPGDTGFNLVSTLVATDSVIYDPVLYSIVIGRHFLNNSKLFWRK